MNIQLNGSPHQLPDQSSIQALVEQLGLTTRRVAVEVNQAIVPKSLHSQTLLQEGDRVEIVHALGGG
jgi:sulfur carrier protein